MIVFLSGGRRAGVSFGLFLPGDYAKLIEAYEYQKFHDAMQNVKNTMTAVCQSVSDQFSEMAKEINERYLLLERLNGPSMNDLFEEMKKEIFEMYLPSEPLPKPHKIIPAFNVYDAYKGRLNYKPVYYHIRSNC